ncbi:uncharacterized protein ACRADG_004600 [Cochliomyia hominivorax]
MNNLLLFVINSLIIGVLSANNSNQCFDILNIIPISQIKSFHTMSFVETIKTNTPFSVFKCFLQESRIVNGEKSVTEKQLEIFQKCNEFNRSKFVPIGLRQLEELMELDLEKTLEHYLRGEITIGDRKNIEESIKYIADKMAQFVESSKEYKNYKDLLLRKIEELQTPRTKELLHNSNNEKRVITVASFSKSGQGSILKQFTSMFMFFWIILIFL